MTTIRNNMVKIAESIASTVTLNDGVVMPLFGFGAFKVQKNGEAEAVISCAINNGYRLIDTAAVYKNEADVGKAINKSGLDRSDKFIVTKVWTDDHGYEQLKNGFQASLKKLDTSYVDLFLIHSPLGGKLVQTFKAMCDLKNEGLIRSVGVSNFGVQHLEGLKKAGLPNPSVNQIELHPWMRREELVNYCRQEGITVMGYSPMAKGKRFDDTSINELAKKYKKTNAQMMIRWSVQNGFITIPKSSQKDRIIANSQVFDWFIEEQDFNTMNKYAEDTCMGRWQPWNIPFKD